MAKGDPTKIGADTFANDEYVFFPTYESALQYFIGLNKRTGYSLGSLSKKIEPGANHRIRAISFEEPEEKTLVFLYQMPAKNHLLGFLYKTRLEGVKSWLDESLRHDAMKYLKREDLQKTILKDGAEFLENLYGRPTLKDLFVDNRWNHFEGVIKDLMDADIYPGPFSEPLSGPASEGEDDHDEDVMDDGSC